MPDYNITLLKESETIFELVRYADDAAGNILFPILLIGIMMVIVLTLTPRYGFQKSMVTAATINTILTLAMSSVNLIADIWLYGFLALWAIGVFMLATSKE